MLSLECNGYVGAPTFSTAGRACHTGDSVVQNTHRGGSSPTELGGSCVRTCGPVGEGVYVPPAGGLVHPWCVNKRPWADRLLATEPSAFGRWTIRGSTRWRDAQLGPRV